MKHTESMGSYFSDGTRVEVKFENESRQVSFRIHGEIDHHGAKPVREQMDEIIAKHHPLTVRMELGGVAFMDSAGLGLMLGRYTRISEYGGRLVLVDPTPGIMKILSLAGADKLFVIEFTDRETNGEKRKKEELV